MTDYAKGFVSGVGAVTLVWLLLTVAYALGQASVRRQAIAAGVMADGADVFEFKKASE